MKLCVLGGCGARSVFLTKSLALSAGSIHVDHLVLMDIEPKRLLTYGELAKAVAQRIDPALRVELTLDARSALQDADYVITTIRAGGDEARAYDEEVCFENGVLGQETTGAGGFAMALRSLPVLRDYCEIAREAAHPGHLIFNFTNPAGIVTQGLRSLGYGNVYGICDAPSGFQKQLAGILGKQPEEVRLTCFGLNHLSWFKDVRIGAQDVTASLLRDPALYEKSEMRLFDRHTLRYLGGCMPNEYLYFYYDRDRAFRSIKGSGKPRGRQILEVNQTLERALEQIDVRAELESAFRIYMTQYAIRENAYFSAESGKLRPETLEVPSLESFLSQSDAGGYAAVALRYIWAITEGRETEMVLSVPNEGSIEGMEEDDVVEITCRIDSRGAHPVRIGAIDPMQLLQMRTIKYFERGVVRAALTGDRDAAVKALYMHPLVNDLSIARKLTGLFFDKYCANRS